MGLAGRGAIAIWNDITDAGRTNFYEWHGRQHIPERLAIPGFLRGRRYVALEGTPEYFTLYETEQADAFRSQDYADRLNDPTRWTLSSTSEFRNVARALCEVEVSLSIGEGALLATWRYDLDDEALEDHRRAMAKTALPQLLASAGVSGVHLLLTDMQASGVDNAERRRRGAPNEIPRCVLMVEGWTDPQAFRVLCENVGRSLLEPRLDGQPAKFGLYQVQITQERGLQPSPDPEGL